LDPNCHRIERFFVDWLYTFFFIRQFESSVFSALVNNSPPASPGVVVGQCAAYKYVTPWVCGGIG
jgi:hypothetical protein